MIDIIMLALLAASIAIPWLFALACEASLLR
jgi:hypothetical protein